MTHSQRRSFKRRAKLMFQKWAEGRMRSDPMGETKLFMIAEVCRLEGIKF